MSAGDIRNILDVNEIYRAKALYCETLDRYLSGRADEDESILRGLWTEDVEVDFSAIGIDPCRGVADVMNVYIATFPKFISYSWHSIHSPVIDVEGDKAMARWTVFALTTRARDPDRRLYMNAGRYVDEFRRVGSQWRQSRLRYETDTVSSQKLFPFAGRTI